MSSDELTHVVPLFPQGAPKWYSKFSSTAQGLLNAAVKGDMSVECGAQAALRRRHDGRVVPAMTVP